MTKVSKKSFKKTLENILENQYCFRDYTIVSRIKFGKISKQGVHQVIELDSIITDVDNALYEFSRDGFGHIYFYI